MSETNSKTLLTLNDRLFDQLERLSVADLKGETLSNEINRTRAMSSLAREIVENAKLALEAQRTLGNPKTTPAMLQVTQ